MKRLLILLAATSLSAPALAQHHGHHPPGHSKPAPKPAAKKPAAKKPAAARPAAKKPVAKPAAKPRPAPAAKPAIRKPASPKPVQATDPHAGHGTGASAAVPHAGHNMPEADDPHAGHAMPDVADPHAGHAMPNSSDPHAGHGVQDTADPHAGHQMSPDVPAPPIAPPPAAAFSGPEHAADLVYGDLAMAQAREEMRHMHGSLSHYKILVDQLEAKIRDGRDGYAWDGQAWYGGDIDKLWLKTEGEGEFGHSVEKAEVQALWSHAIDPWFDLQVGVRHDFRPDPERTHLVLGAQGLAPYWFEVDGALFLSDQGDVTARFEGEYDLRFTQKLILQPRVEVDLAAQHIPELGVGAGLSSGEIGARLRYEIRPEFAPYVGLEYERAFGRTADFRRAEGEGAGEWSLLVGLRTWF